MAGPTDQSFGVHLAKIAGIPRAVIERSKEILLYLGKKELNRLVKESITGRKRRCRLTVLFFWAQIYYNHTGLNWESRSLRLSWPLERSVPPFNAKGAMNRDSKDRP